MDWQALEYESIEKSSNWFWGVGVAALVFLLIALYTKNFLFAIIIVLAAMTSMMYGVRRPELIKYQLSSRGLRVDDRLYPYDHLKSFWVTEQPSRQRLIIESEKMLMPRLVIHLGEATDPEAVRTYLRQYLPEKRHEENLVDALSDFLGF